jgi:hypothetical protein
MDAASNACPYRTRIGPGRAAAFGIVAAGLPLLVHGADGVSSIAAWLVLAATFAGWTWMRACTVPRTAPAIAGMIVAAQVVVHVLYTLAATLAPAGSTNAAHQHHVTHDAGLTVLATMLLVHAMAAGAGAMVLASLDRRAMRSIVRVAKAIRGAVACRLRDARRAVADVAPSIGIPAAHDAVARRLRMRARTLAHRGPPRIRTAAARS